MSKNVPPAASVAVFTGGGATANGVSNPAGIFSKTKSHSSNAAAKIRGKTRPPIRIRLNSGKLKFPDPRTVKKAISYQYQFVRIV